MESGAPRPLARRGRGRREAAVPGRRRRPAQRPAADRPPGQGARRGHGRSWRSGHSRPSCKPESPRSSTTGSSWPRRSGPGSPRAFRGDENIAVPDVVTHTETVSGPKADMPLPPLSRGANAKHQSLNYQPGCLKVVDTFRPHRSPCSLSLKRRKHGGRR